MRVLLVEDDADMAQTLKSSLTADDAPAARAFIRRFLERAWACGNRVSVREFRAFERLLRSGRRLTSTHENEPFRILSVDHLGRCATWSPELLGVTDPRLGSLELGNLAEEPLAALLAKSGFARIQAEIAAGVRACRERCGYFGTCGGGTACNKYFEHGRFDVTETAWCRLAKQAFVDGMLDFVEARGPVARGEARPTSPA